MRRPGIRASWAALALGPALLVLLFAGVSFASMQWARESREAVRHSREVVDRATTMMSQLQDAETGQRGYLLTGQARYLAPYESARARTRADTAALRRVFGDDRVQQMRLDSLDLLIRHKMSELAETIELRRTRGFSASLGVVETDRGKAVMDSIRAVLGAMTVEERARLEQRHGIEAARSRFVSLVLVIGSVIAALVSLLLGMTLYRAAAFESRAVSTLQEQRDELLTQSEELARQAHQLEEQATELEMQNADLQDQAAELEAQTVDLEVASQELAEQTRVAEQARDTAEGANRAKSEFLAMMSHELRTPLNAIAGYAQLMQLGVPEAVPDAHQDYLERIQTSQHHLLGVINAVLNFARLEAGAVLYHIRSVAVGDLLSAVEPLIAPQARAKSLTYTCVPCDRSLFVRADPDKVAQILLNLMSNAVKFTQPGGRITLSAEPEANDGHGEGARVALRVHDTGMGVPPDKLRTIFDPFVQVDQSRTRTTDGAGLGLAISRELARGMGGDLECESELGAGSAFSLFLLRVPAGD